MGTELAPATANLPMIGGSLNVKTGSELCSKGLWALLTTSADRSDGAVRIIALNGTLRREISEVYSALEAWVAPAAPDLLLELLVRETPSYGIATLSGPSEWRAFFGSYLEALKPLPLEAVAVAFTRWSRGEFFKSEKDKGQAAFYPKAVQLFELAQPTRIELQTALWRAKKAIDHVEKLPPPRSSRPTRDELIAQGVLDANGRAILPAAKGIPPTMPTKAPETRAEMAERLRAARAQAPAEDEDGEVV